MKYIAHRGASREAPENTRAAFDLAWKLGADGIELDVHATADDRIVVLHDSNTLRTTGRNAEVKRLAWAELQTLDAGAWMGSKWAKTPIPLLDDVLEQLPEGREIMIEIKGGLSMCCALKHMLAPFAERYASLAVLCFDLRVLRLIRDAEMPVRTFLNVESSVRNPAHSVATLYRLVEQLRSERISGISFGDGPQLDAAFLRACRDAALGTAVWTVDDPARAAFFRDAGADYLMTNDPRRVHA